MIVFQLVIKWKIKKFLNFRVSSLVKMADSDDSFDGEIERMNSEKEVNFQAILYVKIQAAIILKTIPNN